MSELNDLIDDLANWRTGDWDGPSPRDSAIARLTEIGAEAVPALVARLQQLLDERGTHQARLAAAKAEYDAWRAEVDRVMDAVQAEGRFPGDADFRAAGIGDQPTGVLDLRERKDPYELRQGLVRALHDLGDQRAAPVLVAALRDVPCVWYAAMALRDIRADDPVEALLDGLVRTVRNGTMTDDIAATAIGYGVTAEQVIARFEAERTEQGRVNLIDLLAALAAEREVPASAFLTAADDENEQVRWAVTDGLCHLPASVESETTLLVMALDEEESVRWRAISALRQVRGETSSRGGYLNSPLTEEIVRDAVLLRDERVDDRVRARLADLDDPLPVLRALHGLAANGDREAAATLLSGETLFGLILADKTATEAKAAFDAVAAPEDVARFEQFRAAQRKRRRWFRRH